MALIPAGSFQMGSNENSDEQPIHTVTLDAYYIDQYEVTNAEYADFLNARGNQSEGGVTWLVEGDSDVLITQNGGEWQPKSGYGNYPVVGVSWYGAAAYCEWRGARLPTEAEWEKAARGTDDRTYPWGEEMSCKLANHDATRYFGDCVGDTTSVGGYPDGASPYGALDMAGNAWEWVADWYCKDTYSQSPETNPTGLSCSDSRVRRGGSWEHSSHHSRTVSRSYIFPGFEDDKNGFRCAVSLSAGDAE